MDLQPRLEVIIGTMFTGKTTELIRRINRYEITGKKAQLFKPKIDDRYSLNHVASHDGLKRVVSYVSDLNELKEKYNPNLEILGVDEPQFMESGIVKFCEDHVSQGGIAVVSVLMKDFQDNYFKFRDGKMDTSEFIRVADHVDFLTAYCTFRSQEGKVCGNTATRVQRLIDNLPAPKDSPLQQVGGTESYAPRCRHHFQFYR